MLAAVQDPSMIHNMCTKKVFMGFSQCPPHACISIEIPVYLQTGNHPVSEEVEVVSNF